MLWSIGKRSLILYPPALTYFYCCIEVAITISSLGFIAVCNAHFLLDADSKRQCDDWCLNSICRSTGGQFYYIYFSLNPQEYYNIFSHNLNMVLVFHLSNSILTLFSSCDEHVVLLKKNPFGRIIWLHNFINWLLPPWQWYSYFVFSCSNKFYMKTLLLNIQCCWLTSDLQQ